MNNEDRKPYFQDGSNGGICCPTCNTSDTVCMSSKCSETQFEHVIWCAGGHVTYLDRHDDATHLLSIFDLPVMKAVPKKLRR